MYHIENIEMLPITLALKKPFQTAHHVITQRPITIIKLNVHDFKTNKRVNGFGEIQAFNDFNYTLENQAVSQEIIRTIIAPVIKSLYFKTPQEFAGQLAKLTPFGSFAKASVEMAVWDAVGKLTHRSLSQMIGGVRSNVAVGIALGVNATHAGIENAINKGYQRIKIKIDAQTLEINKLVSLLNDFPNQQFSLDANSSFNLKNVQILNQLPDNIDFVEQPFSENDFVDHACFQKTTKHVLSLDESINSIADVYTMIALRAAKAITIKQAKIGGITAALTAIDEANNAGVKPWIGGMLSSNLGRGVDLALASLANVAFPGDISESERYFKQDITVEKFQLSHGTIAVPETYGIGVTLE